MLHLDPDPSTDFEQTPSPVLSPSEIIWGSLGLHSPLQDCQHISTALYKPLIILQAPWVKESIEIESIEPC